ncbi:MAG: DEAD/DEAH box helicase [Ruminiclostridium sp.]
MKLRDYQQDLITGVHNAWAEGYKRPCIVLPCGGGKSIITADMAKRTTERGKNVLFLVHRQELCEQISSTFTDYGVNMDCCHIGMVQTVTRRLDKIQRPALIITDENHHCLAASYKRIYEHFNTYCVGVTATPVRLNGGGLGDINDKLIIGISAKELIRWKCLAPYDYYAPPVADLSGIKSRGGDYAAEDIEAALDKPHIYGDVIKNYKQLADGVKAVCYCATVKHSQDMAEAFRAAGIPAEHIDGNTPKTQRADIIRGFREGSIKILCNVDLISEGFDVPDCGASILLRPTKSLTLYIQQAMRCMRYQPDKKAIIIDHVGNVHRHGLPDADREWSLDPKPPSKKKNTVSVRQCTECFYTHTPAPVCPNCGHVYEIRQQATPKEIREAKLQQIVAAYTVPAECKTIQELYAYAKMKGYRPGWAYHQCVQRGLLH